MLSEVLKKSLRGGWGVCVCGREGEGCCWVVLTPVSVIFILKFFYDGKIFISGFMSVLSNVLFHFTELVSVPIFAFIPSM